MKPHKYQVVVNALKARFQVTVNNAGEYDLVVFERISVENGWVREIRVPLSDKYVMISGDSSGVEVTGYKDNKKIHSVDCNDLGDLAYYATDLLYDPIDKENLVVSNSETITSTSSSDDKPGETFETPFEKKLNAVYTILKSVKDGLLINMNITNSLDMTLAVGMKIEGEIIKYILAFPKSSSDDIVKNVIRTFRTKHIPDYIEQAIANNKDPIDISKHNATPLQDAEWYKWFIETDEYFAQSNNRNNVYSSSKLQTLSAMVARIHDGHSIPDIASDLNVGAIIVTMVKIAYDYLKPADNSTYDIYKIIGYIVNYRIANNVKDSIKNNDTLEQTAKLGNVSVHEAEWLTWFVEFNDEQGYAQSDSVMDNATIKGVSDVVMNSLDETIDDDKLPLLNAIIARIHAGQNTLKITSELKVSIVIVIMVTEAYNHYKPMINDVDIIKIINYILDLRYNIKTLVEQNTPPKQIAKKTSLSIEEAKWFIWFVKFNKENAKS